MRIVSVVALLALGLLAPAVASAQSNREDFSTALKDTYACDATYSNYASCVELKNEMQSFSGPGKLTRNRPLRFVASQVKCSGNSGFSTYTYWNAQRSIAPNAIGAAQTNGWSCAGGTFIYGMRVADGPLNYQAMIGVVANPYYLGATGGCLVMSYLACSRGAELETGRDSRIVYTITTRPLEIKILNSLPLPLERANGPYWGNALWVPAADSAATIAPAGAGYTGALRSVVRSTSYSAIYRVQKSMTDTRWNGALVAIDVQVGLDGTRAGTCTPVYAPSHTRLECSVEFTGSGTGAMTAIVRVRP